ncbi:hypothetical protein J1G43_18705 [Cellulomonas sp. zg-ZUI22]|uniref:DUF6518 family protein n=1 Tax=Cellulomonas sp. zg-ZUI22 TaxID=2816955 RepID=UPI001A940E77|nr:DUF6518 family protein [Cellulomonas sp. zg-ZUI22]MBO0901995.1 hypothetical protein [Cellulomonas sp. zg-ZUI22]
MPVTPTVPANPLPAPAAPTGHHAPEPAAGRGRLPGFVAVALAVPVGLTAGVLTSFGQTVLPGPLGGLANAVTPWLVVPFVLGALTRRWGWALAAGVLACLGEVAGYYLTSHLRGFGTSSSWVLFWLVCALPGGGVGAVAGWSWRRDGHGDGPSTRRGPGFGGAVLVAAWWAEAVVVYLALLGYVGHAVVFVSAGVLTFVVLGRYGRQHGGIARWLVPALVLAGAGFAVVYP